jgi:uncharacterized protein with NRDE domain
MCIAVFAVDQGSYPLVMAANRDEWIDRPAAPMRWWTGANSSVLAGQDLSAGGTWFGVNLQGRFGLITNIRSETILAADADRPSRGKLILQWLNFNGNAKDFETSFDPTVFAGFNLVFGDMQTATIGYLSNQSAANVASFTSGFYGLSNASLNTPWPKVIALKKSVKECLLEGSSRADQIRDTTQTSELHAALLKALLNPLRFDENASLSAINVLDLNFMNTTRAYGRRCSTTLTVDTKGKVVVSETQTDGSNQMFDFKL